ncbi:MAG: hypothetical protein DRN29_06305 [Thermoplasmata archaeon]|nr:MAG: hypothetical protein DRN29_06305 [Thermoplasmata archaeon]
MAGFEVKRIINEPTATANYSSLNRCSKSEKNN